MLHRGTHRIMLKTVSRRCFASAADIHYDAKSDHYKVLGVTEKMGEKDIKKAYYKLAHKYHPDKAGESGTEKFKEISAAWEVIGDADSRKKYDEAKRVKSETDRYQSSASGYSHSGASSQGNREQKQ